jgi:predicted permease
MRLTSLWRNLAHRRRVDRELDEELRATLDLLVEEKIRAGLDEQAARRAARVELGSLESLKGQVQEVRAGAGLDVLMQDVRYALRLFRRSPGFTALAVATLALGIGANAAIFGVVKSVLLDRLPYSDADRLVRVYGRARDGTRASFQFRAAPAHAIMARQRSFESIAAFDSARDAVYGREEAARIVRIAWVEPRLFQTLGVSAALGRTLQDHDRAEGHVPASGAESGPDTARAVVASHAAWQRLFAGDSDVIGREVHINRLPRTVIGVLPRGYVGPMGEVDFYLGFDLVPALNTGAGWLGLVGRLKPGVTWPELQAQAATLPTHDLGGRPHEENIGVVAIPLRDAMVGRTRTPLLVLLASAALVLLITCANLAGALLSRGLSRRKELGVRVALGAGRPRLVRQLLTESALLGLAGGAAGLLLAQSLLTLLSGFFRPVLPAYASLSLDLGAMAVTTVVALGTGLLCGVAPALAVEKVETSDTLRDQARGASEGRRPRRVRGLLVAGQMAVCASLLAGAGLLARSLWEMATDPLGFDPGGVLSASVSLLPQEYPTLTDRTRFRDRLLDRLRLLPGVDAVAVANKPPTAVTPRHDPLRLEGGTDEAVAYATVSDDYFRVLRIPLREGRTFDASDREGGPPTAVVSETLARRYWPDGNAIGARAFTGGQPVTVVGVVGDVRNDLARHDAEPMLYRSYRQESTGRVVILLRPQGDPMTFVRTVEREVAAIDPRLPVQNPMPLRAAIGEGLDTRRLPVMLIGAFGLMALVLSSVGVYAMFASMALAREREFGVRLALGSRPSAIAALVLRQGAGWMAVGLAGGALGVMAVEQLLRGWLYGVPPFDPLALGGAVATLLGCAALALLAPVRRAIRVDPMVTLRAE